MRVISQDGTMDSPYDNSLVFMNENSLNNEFYVKIQLCGAGATEIEIIAKYSSREKAIKAMEMLREAYTGMPIVMQNVAISEDLATEFERLKKCCVMVRAENQPSKADFISNAVFQFPQDDEIEV